MAGHTSAPWKHTDLTILTPTYGGRGYIAVEGQDRCHVCDIFPFGNRRGAVKPTKEECFANAKLIAAAPDLLKACEAAVNALRSYQYSNASTELAEEIADFVAAAIARATPSPTDTSESDNG